MNVVEISSKNELKNDFGLMIALVILCTVAGIAMAGGGYIIYGHFMADGSVPYLGWTICIAGTLILSVTMCYIVNRTNPTTGTLLTLAFAILGVLCIAALLIAVVFMLGLGLLKK